MASAGAAVTLAAIVALGTHRSAPPPGAEARALPESASIGQATPQPTGQGLPAPLASNAPNTGLAPNSLSTSGGVVSADVPLFGATPMATMEPAPLAPPPSSEAASEEAAEKAEAKASVSAVPSDERFAEESDGKADKAKSKKKPEDVAPWGHGKVVEPVVHRLRLDAPGDALQGALQPTGFTVVVPNRKVMEKGDGIAKRDPRIAHVRTVNTPNGAQITFQFKDGTPAYKTRLRRDYVEILIGAPEKSEKHDKVEKAEKHDKALPSAKDNSKSKPAAKAPKK
jgi:hypothetical protein